MARVWVWFTAVWIAMAAQAQAQSDPVVVVELFTSQGCSSCPPADRLLQKLGGHDDVIPLALHVDYWDYIGWKDSFGQAAWTKRQKGYAQANHKNMVYTPQMVINGQDEVVGNRPMEVADLIQRHRQQPPRMDLSVTRQGNQLSIRGRAKGNLGRSEVYLLRYIPEQQVKITRGENAGLTASYSYIVTDMTRLRQWNGNGNLSVDAQISGDAPLVVLVQTVGYGPILAAARLR